MPRGPDFNTVRLRTALRDLVALSTVPAAWVGRDPSAIAVGLADVLFGSLDLDFAFVRLRDPKGGAAVEVTRGDAWKSFPEWLQRYSAIGHFSHREVIPDVGAGGQPCRGVVMPIGVDAEGGLIAAASGRTNFPDEIDQLLLSVAGNHGATACQNASLLHERRRAEEALREARDELETKVAERTAELRRTAAELQEREAKIRRLVDANIIGIFIWDFDGRILEANDAFLSMLGYDREDLLAGRLRWTELTPPDWRDRETVVLREHKMTGRLHPFEKEYFRKDGSRVPVLIGAATVEEGGSQGVAFVLDLSERKRAETERLKLEERLRQAEKMEAVGRLAGGIAHDFNNVLAGILAYGDMLFEEAPADSARKRYAQNVLAAATRGRALVEQILTYSRSQRGKRVPTDVCRVLTETLELVRGSLPANISVDASTSKLPLIVIGDATQLHQVVMNLCSNAIQAMGAGGALHVTLEAAEIFAERALSHGTLRPGHYVRLSIEDSGTGMDVATLSRIFEPFFTTKEVGRGTGLGLSLVYAIVTDLGGAIDVKSALEQGSVFAVYLPRVEIARALSAEAEASPSASVS
ncbi:MAG: sensory box protein [Betaproteobacteria bacterium]|nr:sensory box protein [Betaproteobacteria bacterium]